jgi:hypothetical protein
MAFIACNGFNIYLEKCKFLTHNNLSARGRIIKKGWRDAILYLD